MLLQRKDPWIDLLMILLNVYLEDTVPWIEKDLLVCYSLVFAAICVCTMLVLATTVITCVPCDLLLVIRWCSYLDRLSYYWWWHGYLLRKDVTDKCYNGQMMEEVFLQKMNGNTYWNMSYGKMICADVKCPFSFLLLCDAMWLHVLLLADLWTDDNKDKRHTILLAMLCAVTYK